MKTPEKCRMICLPYRLLGLALSLIWLCPPCPAVGAEGEANSDASQRTINRLAEAVRAGREVQLQSIIKELQGRGLAAVPAIRSALRTEPRTVRSHLVFTLGGIAGDAATHTLFDTALNDPDPNVARNALSRIGERRIRRPLLPDERETIVRRIRTGSSGEARTWAYTMAHSGLVDSEEIAEVIVERFVKDVRNPPAEAKEMPYRMSHGMYVSREASVLNNYLRAFHFANSQALVPVLRRYQAAATDDKPSKWLVIARGMAGESDVKEEVLEIVQNTNEDSSMRAVALRAYVRAAMEEAIPVLESLLNDRSPGPDPLRPPVAVVASDQLFWLRNPEKRKEFWGK